MFRSDVVVVRGGVIAKLSAPRQGRQCGGGAAMRQVPDDQRLNVGGGYSPSIVPPQSTVEPEA